MRVTCSSYFSHLTLPFSTHLTAVGEAPQGVDSVGLFMVVLAILEHNVLAQQLCRSVVTCGYDKACIATSK